MDLIEWVYSGGDVFMAQCKLILFNTCLHFALMLVSVIRDSIKVGGF